MPSSMEGPGMALGIYILTPWWLFLVRQMDGRSCTVGVWRRTDFYISDYSADFCGNSVVTVLVTD